MRVRHVTPCDMLVRDGEGLLLYDSQLVRLSELGLAIIELSRNPIDHKALAESLLESFGSPADGDVMGATRAALDAMCRLGVLERID